MVNSREKYLGLERTGRDFGFGWNILWFARNECVEKDTVERNANNSLMSPEKWLG